MTRPRVPPEARQRTANACDSCKKRKSKCDGLNPCRTCSTKHISCVYSPEASHSSEPPTKKQKTDNANQKSSPRPSKPASAKTSTPSSSVPTTTRPANVRSTSASSAIAAANWGYSEEANAFGNFLHLQADKVSSASAKPKLATSSADVSQPSHVQFASPVVKIENHSKQDEDDESKGQAASRGTTASMGDEEAVLYAAPPMVQDSMGRLVYLGESATLSFLQLLRLLVENVAGDTPFTNDPRRHHIIESTSGLPPGVKHTHLLPDRLTADVLVDSYFTNTHGFIQAFDQPYFLVMLDACYADPLQADPSWLCLLNLVFAIGLSMSNPAPGTNEEAVIEKLRGDPLDRSEIFYANAKSLHDPVTGFEDAAGFWSVQALLLMAIYMLLVSKRNAAFAYFGMAVRYGFALGLHREETFVAYTSAEQEQRRNVWRTLFVMDRFLSASLGRPTAIKDSDCSGSTLQCTGLPTYPHATDPSQSHLLGLEAAVRSSHAIGDILRRVYQRRRISTRLGQEIADACKQWPEALAPVLHWGQAAGASQSHGVAILHVNLLYCHSIILLTRPFFLNVFSTATQRMAAGEPRQQFGARMEKFAEACVIASTHSIGIVRTGWVAGVVSRRNPFVNYFLFTSTLVVLSNAFGKLYPNAVPEPAISQAIAIMGACGSMDPQAQRHFEILSAFRDVVIQRQNPPLSQGLMPKVPVSFPGGGVPPAFGTQIPEVEMAMPFSASAGPAEIVPLDTDPLAPFYVPGPPFDVSTTPTATSVPNFASSTSVSVPNGTQSIPLTVSSDGSAGQNIQSDEAVEFESFWTWATQAQTPAAGLGDGTDTMGEGLENGDGDEAGPLDPSVPLYGLVDFS